MISIFNIWKNMLPDRLLDPCSNLDIEDDLEEINFLPFDFDEIEDQIHRNACYLLSQRIIHNIEEEERFRCDYVYALFEYVYLHILDDLKKERSEIEKFISDSRSYHVLNHSAGTPCDMFRNDDVSMDSLFELIELFLNLDKD